MNYEFLDGLKLPKLSTGAHAEGSGKLCIMEAIAFIQREPHSDNPECTADEVSYFCQALNDRLPDELRPRLWEYAIRIAGTNDPAYTQERLDYLAIKACSMFAATACDGLIEPELVEAMRKANTVDEARAAAAAARAAAARAAAHAAAATRAAAAAARAAADAADDAADAVAYAAAYAAADAAGAAADAAADAAGAAAAWEFAFEVLDGLLDIGPAPKPLKYPERIRDLATQQ